MYNNYSKQYSEWCEFYDPENLEMNVIHRYLSFNNASVLEIGCGTGRFTQRILSDNPNSIIAMDNDIDCIKIAKTSIKNTCAKFLLMDANNISMELKRKSFDYVVFSWSLNYIDNIRKVLIDAITCCKKGGKIVILFPVESEYSRLIRTVKKHDFMDCYSNEYVLLIKHYFEEQNLFVIEDEIVTYFKYCSYDEAVLCNLFHWELIHTPLTVKEIDDFKNKLKFFENNDGNIYLPDKVRLIIGG